MNTVEVIDVAVYFGTFNTKVEECAEIMALEMGMKKEEIIKILHSETQDHLVAFVDEANLHLHPKIMKIEPKNMRTIAFAVGVNIRQIIESRNGMELVLTLWEQVQTDNHSPESARKWIEEFMPERLESIDRTMIYLGEILTKKLYPPTIRSQFVGEKFY